MIRAVIASVAILVLAACGGGAEEPAKPTAVADKVPKCSSVWVDGGTLPENYEGCSTSSAVEAPVVYDCDSGIGRFTTYEDRFYALLGDTIHAYSGDDDASYAKAYEDCFADPG